MFKYENEDCPVCMEKFKESDDIVVCPQCGAPYHRNCYISAGKCEFEDKHAEGFEWKSKLETVREQLNRMDLANNTKTIIIDENENVTDINGKPINENMDDDRPKTVQELMEYNRRLYRETIKDKENEVIDDVTVKELASFLGNSTPYFLPLFLRFAKSGSKASFNLFAAFLLPFQQFYRKMNLYGIILSIISFICVIPQLFLTLSQSAQFAAIIPDIFSDEASVYGISQILYMVSLAQMIIAGVFNDFFFMKSTIRKIKRIRFACQSAHTDDEAYYALLYRAGKPSFLNMFFFGIAAFSALLIILFSVLYCLA